METLIGISHYFGVPMVVTALITVTLCQYRVACKKPVSAGTVFVAAASMPIIFAIVTLLFFPDAWSTANKGPGPLLILMLLGFVTVISFLPAGIIVALYQRPKKRERTPAV